MEHDEVCESNRSDTGEAREIGDSPIRPTFPAVALRAYLGIEFLGMVDGAVTLQLDLSQKHMSRANRVHGGVLFTLLFSALGRAILNELPMGRSCATVEIKVNYFRPVQSGRVTARGWKRELTNSLGYAEGEVVNEEGKVLARASGTFLLTKSMRQDDRERV